MLLALGLIFLILAVLSLSVALGVIGGNDRDVRRRLYETGPRSTTDTVESAIRFQQRAEGFLVKLVTTPTMIAKLERNLVLAGSPDEWPISKLMAYKVVGLLFGVAVAFLQLSQGLSLVNLVVAIAAVVVGYFGADVIVVGIADRRQTAIQKDLADILDQVSISLDAGLGFDAALAHIGSRRTGPAADEVVRTVQDIRLGVPRREAYQSLADRNNIDDLNRFARALQQADQHGVSVTNVVRNQAIEMRDARKKRAEETAAKVPVKIIFPLMVCILPVLFAVILTPAIINITRNI